MLSCTDLFRGMWVDVEKEVRTGTRYSEGGRGLITNFDSNNNITIKYLISNTSSPNVKLSRIKSADMILSGRKKSWDGTTTPSLLSHLYGEFRSQQMLQLQNDQEETRVVDCNPHGQLVNTSLLLNMMLGGNNVVDVVKKMKDKKSYTGKRLVEK